MAADQVRGDDSSSGAPRKQLSLFDSTCLIVGIIIGAGVYVMSPMIAQGALCWWGVLAIWAVAISGGITFVASYFPARRAARLDPVATFQEV